LVTATRRHFSRKSERGTTVLVVVMVTTLITAIGVFAVRNISQIDQAVGYSRQSAQTSAFAELGTSAAMAQMVATGNGYAIDMEARDPNDPLKLKPAFNCEANGPYASASLSTCYPLSQERIDSMTSTNSGETLVEPSVAGSESGSFGPLANTTGYVKIEFTEKRPTNTPIGGFKAGESSASDITLTTIAVVSPIASAGGQCGENVATVSVKKVMRSHVIVPPRPGT
jgi:hypothetical protein